MGQFIGFAFWAVTVMAMGYTALVIADPHGRARNFEALGLSFLIGTGVMTIEMFFMSLLGIRFSPGRIVLPWCLIIPAVSFILKPWRVNRFEFRFPVLNRIEWLLSSGILFEALYALFRAGIKPFESYDSVAIYALKAKIFYFAGMVPKDFFSMLPAHFHGAHPDYPFYMSLGITSIYCFIGAFNDFLGALFLPMIFCAFLAVFHAVLKNILMSRTRALLYTFMLVSVQQFNAYAANGYTDLPLGAFFGLAVMYLYMAFTREEAAYMRSGMIFTLLALWTKNEGLALLLIMIFVVTLFAVRHRQQFFKLIKPSAACIPGIFLMTGVFLFMKVKDKVINENFNLSMVTAHNLASGLSKVPMILYEYQKHLFGFKKWNLIWMILVLALVIFRRKIRSGKIGYVALAVGLFFIFYSAMYVFSSVDSDYLLRTTGSRFMLHILPVCVFLIALLERE